MKLIGQLAWADFLRLSNHGSRSFTVDVKEENVKIRIEKPAEGKTSQVKLINESDLTLEERIHFQAELLNLLSSQSRSATYYDWNDFAQILLFSVCHLLNKKPVLSFA